MIKFCENEHELCEIAKIHTDSIKQTYIGILDQEYLDSLSYEEYHQTWKSEWKRIDKEIIIAVEDGEVIGFSMVLFSSDKKGCGYLLRLHVKKAMQGRGIGKKLLSASAGCLWNMGIYSMQIGVIGGNDRAEAVYRSLGAKYIRSYVNDSGNMKVQHKRFIWYDISELADKTFYREWNYNYDYKKIYRILDDKFILFGTGDYCEVFRKEFPDAIPQKIFDNDSKKWGTLKNGVEIEAPLWTMGGEGQH